MGETPDRGGRLTPGDGAALLRLARAAITDRVCGGNSVDAAVARLPIGAALRAPRGVFVTLRSPGADGTKGALRGCLGTIVSDAPLYRNVIDTAPRSALNDPRFEPLTAAELAGVVVEVSALTPLEPIASVDRIAVGTDGVQLTHARGRSVFLPQVAVEQRWSSRQLLERLALKAGLGRDDWREAELAIFQAEVFVEPRGERPA